MASRIISMIIGIFISRIVSIANGSSAPCPRPFLCCALRCVAPPFWTDALAGVCSRVVVSDVTWVAVAASHALLRGMVRASLACHSRRLSETSGGDTRTQQPTDRGRVQLLLENIGVPSGAARGAQCDMQPRMGEPIRKYLVAERYLASDGGELRAGHLLGPPASHARRCGCCS